MQTIEKPKSLRSQALVHLRDAIVTGELEPGSMHSEQGLATRLATSRTPIREALLQLAAEGFVEFIPQRGVRITKMNPVHLAEVFQYRVALDSYCAEELARRPTPQALALLDEQLLRQRQIIANGDALQWIRANMDFHVVVAECVGNSVMTEAISAVASHTMRVGFQLLSTAGRMQSAHDEHVAIVQAIREGQADLARDRARAHIGVTDGQMRRQLQSVSQA